MSQAAGPQEIIADVSCRECGYNLRHQRVDGLCPECGSAVLPSLFAPLSLSLASGPWLRRVRRGACLLIAGYGSGLLVFFVAVWFDASWLAQKLSSAVLIMMFALLVAGSFLFTTREQHVTELIPPRVLRWTARSSSLVAGLSLFLGIVCRDDLLLPVFYFALTLSHVSTVLVTLMLTRRVPDNVLTRSGAAAVVVLLLLSAWAWTGTPASDGIVMIFLLVMPVMPAACLLAFLLRAPRTGRSAPDPLTCCTVATTRNATP